MNAYFASDYDSIINIITVIGSIFSISAAFFVIFLFWFFKENRTFHLELVIWYSIFNILYSVSVIPNYSERSVGCAIQSFSLSTFQYAGMVWTCIIGYTCFMSVIRRNHIEKHKSTYRKFFLVTSLLIPSGVSSIILFTDTYGNSGGICWLDLYNENYKLINKLIMFYYCLFWFFIILNMFFVFKLILIIKEKKTKEHAYLFKMYSNMTWYPIIQTICCIPGTINRIYDIINTRTMFTLSVIQAVFDSFEGCFVLIVFIFSPSIKHSIKICWHKLRNRETNDGNILNSNSFTQDEQILSPNYFNDRNSDKENKFYTNF